MDQVVGIDVGGTNIKFGLVSAEGVLSHSGQTPTPQNDPEATELIESIAEIVSSLSQHEPLAVGVAVPGVVTADGVAKFSGTLGFRDLPLRELIRSRVGLPSVLVHDVTASGVAESRVGAARGQQQAVVIQIGTGIASTLILNGEVYRPHPIVGEIGHTPSAYDRPCPCGLRGCLEMTASGGAVRRNFEALTGQKATAVEVFARAQEGDESASIIYREFVDALSTAIHWLASVLGPDLVILSGGVATSGEFLLDDLNAALDQKLSFHHRPQLTVSASHHVMGTIGVGLSAWDVV